MATLTELKHAIMEEISSWGADMPEAVSVPGIFLVDVFNKLNLAAQEWISVEKRLPNTDRPVLAVKQLKDGRRDVCIARCLLHFESYDHTAGRNVDRGPYWVCGGNNNIIYWMEIPEWPKEAKK